MKKFYSLLVCAILALTSMTASAADYYLVGEMNGWIPDDASLKLSDNGDGTFVLELNQTFDAQTEFKISNGSWDLCYGQGTTSNVVNPGVLYPVSSSGGNLAFPAGTEVKTITFNPTQETVLVNDLELYLRGEVSGASWDAVDDWKFTKESANVYTLTNKTLKGGFKVADKEWQKANWGITGSANPVLGTEYVMTQNGGNLSISETYCSKITVTLDNNGGATLLLEQKVPELVITGYEGYFTATCEDGIALGAEEVVSSTNNRLEDWDSWKSSWTTEIVSDTEIKLVPTGDLTTAEEVPPFYLFMEAGYFVLNPNGTKTLSSKLSGYNLNMTVPAAPAEPLTIDYTYPADNAEVESFNNLYIMFNVGDDGIGLYSNIAITATSEDGLTTYTGYADYTQSSYKDANVTFTESFAPGKYTITIPAGVFYDYSNNASQNEETTITITVKEPAPAVEVPTYTAQDYTSLMSSSVFRGNHALVDMNNDGKLDLMYKGRDVANGWATVIQVAVSDGTKFTSTVDLPDNDGCSWSRQIYAIDYNNDGYMDYILGQSWGYAQLFKNNGDMTFTRVDEFTAEPFLVETRDLSDETIEIFGSNLLAVADFNMDGWKDIVSMTENQPVLYTNNGGNGTFTRQNESGIAPTRNGTVSVGDYNNDGYPDLLVNGWNDTVGNHCLQINKNNGDGTFTAINFDFNLGLHGSEKGTSIFVDVNGDGLLDVFCTGESMSNGWAKIANVYVNNGDDTFTATASLTSCASGNADWCDLNGDGLTDIVYAGGIDSEPWGMVNVAINAGQNTFVQNTSLISNVRGGAVVEAADYNGDGMPDIIAEGYGDPCFAIYNGSTSVANQAPVAPTSLAMTEGESNVTFTWQAGSDAETPEAALRYNIYVKKTDGTVVTLVNADTETGALRVADVNASLTTCSYTLNINAADIVAWGVQTIDQAKAASVFTTQVVKVPEMVITGYAGYISVSCVDGIALGAEDVVGNVDNHLEDSYNWESFFTTEVVSETEIKLIPTEDITTAEPPFYLCLVEGFFVLDPNGTKTLSKTLEYYEVDMTIPAEPLTIAYTYPADNAEVESFNNLYIMFNVGDNGIGLYANIAITATSEDGLTTYTGYADYTQDSYQDANVTFAESFAPGKYTITIPAGVFYDYDNKASKNEETKITITVKEQKVPEMVITGHEGYISVSCVDGIALGAEDVVGNVDNHLEDSYNWESFFTTEVVSETEIKLIPTEDITTAEPPFYLCLVEGFFVLDPNGTKTLSKTLEYYEVDMTIPAEPLTIAYTYPADNAEVESFNNLYIMFNVGDNGIGLYANIAITATSEDGLTTYTGYADYTQDSYQDANVTFAESFAPGKYTITIPAGVFYDYDNKASKNEETKITITVLEPVVSDPMAIVDTNPANNAEVESFKYMWIKFNMQYGYNSEAEITAVNVADATVAYTGYPLFYEDWDEEYNQATLEFAESFAPGTYEITIPAGTFWEYGNESNILGETKFTITVIEPVSGIAGVIADNGVYVVYNLQGVKLMETENVEDLNKLTEGFYIINGNKVAIRK